MRVYKDEEMRWSMLRYDSRTFTAQQAKMLKGDVTRTVSYTHLTLPTICSV